MKRFLYAESTDGGMSSQIVSDAESLNLYGWMDESCKEEDEALVEWLKTADVGEFKDHRLGVMIRLKDEEEAQ